MSIAKSLDLAFDRGKLLGCTAMQLFVCNPRGWAVNKIERPETELFIKKDASFDIKPVAHMPYLPNLASSDSIIYNKSTESLKLNLEICNSLGIKYLVMHLGSHMGHGSEKGIRNIVNGLESVADNTGDTTILLENEAGHSNAIGAKLEDMTKIYDDSSLPKKKRLGFCLDTCHLFAAGYDIRKESELDRIADELEMDKVYALHVNDAKFELGSRKDRHENIGFGHIGKDGFKTLLNYGKIKEKILILETPMNPALEPGYEVKLLRKISENS